MGRVTLTFCKNWDELDPLSAEELDPLSEEELITLSHEDKGPKICFFRIRFRLGT